ncbi:hypothetical protein H9X85_07975 [Anaerotignum lactatifermentans]|uniref:Uncharacterized protein n=1 Tax=Anaerotignum lactatifermentans TaxID=160404 RepID=A0ABS2GAF6_9FIRM|nr:hypothetical protein [Anaerotignum lactatifermentans]MBM6829531.1 hypothetical protein [Anaerotignum lactatifermentans]MBM6878025.1 hypothetical protein [Anaerotignum lactatifermentans]MBM6951145.1 hypothetical protein [Anaerotignum lactatifermentans]
MRRIKAACLIQTLHFLAKEDMPKAAAAKMVQDEIAHYKHQMESKRIPYNIISESVQPDGSVLLEVKKQYQLHSCGHYLD